MHIRLLHVVMGGVFMFCGTLPAQQGYLKAKVNPGRAGVFVDGKYLGPAANFKVARTYSVPAGEHEIRLLDPRYEDLVTKPEMKLHDVCEFLDLKFEVGMLEYYRDVDPGQLRDHARLREAPTPGSRDWRTDMRRRSVKRVEAIAGDLLGDLGYERAFPAPSAAARVRAALDRQVCRVRLGSGRFAVWLARRTPIWRLRHRCEGWRSRSS